MTRDDIRAAAVHYIRRLIADGWRCEQVAASLGCGHLGDDYWIDIRHHRIEVKEVVGCMLEPAWHFNLESVWREAERPDRSRVEQATLF